MNRTIALTLVTLLALNASACRRDRFPWRRHFFRRARTTTIARPNFAPMVALGVGVGAQSNTAALGHAEFLQYQWLSNCSAGCLEAQTALSVRFADPSGYHRIAVSSGSFGEWLRSIPLAGPGVSVNDVHGKPAIVTSAGYVAAVVAIDMHAEDPADALLRLHAEWKFSSGDRLSISYASNSGRLMPFSRWIGGERIVAKNQTWNWAYKTAPLANPTYADLRNFLDSAYQWTDPRALAIQGTVLDATDIAPGDYFVHAGKDPTLVIVLDVAKNETGEFAMLLGHVAAPHQELYVMQASKASAWLTPHSNQEIAAPGLRPFVWKEHRRLPKAMRGDPN